MSGGNSWTILTSEEPVAESLKPSAGGADHNGESHTSPQDSGETAQPANGTESADALHVDDYLVSEVKPAELSANGTDQHASESAAESPASSCFQVSASLVHCDDENGHAEVPSEDQGQSGPDTDPFSDSYTHVTPSPDEPRTETLGSVELSQEEEGNVSLEATLHPLNGESDGYLRTPDVGKQADSEVADEKTGQEGAEEEEEPEVRKRRSLLAALEQIGRREEEEVEEEFQLPRRDDDSGFSVNKCILGAVILLGLGTIFFSGVFMDLDEESEYNTRELHEAATAAAAGKQEWLNPEVPPHPVDADSSELLNKLAEENEQISVLQAQLQAQKDELKVAMGQAAEGAAERLRWEEVEKENTPQTEPDPVKLDATPPGGQPEESRPETAASEGKEERKQWDERKEEKKKDLKKEKHDAGERKVWKGKDKSAWKEGEQKEHQDGDKTERKRVMHGSDKKEKEGKHQKQGEETKQWKEKEWKKDKDKRGDEGKPWKNRDGKKEWKDEKDGKKGKSEKVNEGKQWRGKGEEKDWKSGKDHGEKQRSKEEWKKSKDGFREGGKDRKEWKEKEKKEWKDKSGKGRGERKQWEGGAERTGKEERKQFKEQEWKGKHGKQDKEWKRKDKKFEEDEWKRGGQKEKKHHGDVTKDKPKKSRFAEDHLYGERKPSHSHRKASVDQPEYWVQQKDRLHHDPAPPQQCDSVASCAQQERLRPVPLAEFHAILQSYLAKAMSAGVDKSKMEELLKLTPDFFQDGVFVHDQISFRDFAEDVGDILEDMVEVDESGDEEDSAIEEEMEGFEREVMKTFLAPGAGEREKRVKGEWRKESAPGRG
ncbi:unnamed protein product [Ophioblennius macclurei]